MDAVAQDWGATGLAFLTGMPDGPPDFSRAAVPATPPVVRSSAAELGADNALVDRMVAERRFAPC